MIKLTDILKSAFKPKIQECVVVTMHLDGETYLAKNRDRAYDPTVEVIHELINGVEVMYLHDKLTDWAEGMNEHGIGIVNASLMVHYDEMEADIMKNKGNDKDKKALTPSFDGLKIKHALSKTKLKDAIKSIINFAGEDKKDVGVKGMTMVADPKHAFVIEMTSEHLPVVKKIDKPKVTIRTNHGISYPDTGYTEGIKRKSSISRMEIAKKELEKITNPDDILDTLSKQWVKDNFMNPYRRDNDYNMHTTGQIMMNLDELKFYFRWDKEHSEFEGYVNRLPANYKPRITLELLEETD
jgi:dipeptidase